MKKNLIGITMRRKIRSKNMPRTDAVPEKNGDFDAWLKKIDAYVTDKTSQGGPWVGHIPAEKVEALSEHYNNWHTAYEKTTEPHTSVDIVARNNARKAAEAFLRPFIAQYLMFPPVTDADREAMGIHNRDTTRTTIPVPATRPIITELKPLGGFQVQVRFRDETTPRNPAHHDHVAGAGNGGRGAWVRCNGGAALFCGTGMWCLTPLAATRRYRKSDWHHEALIHAVRGTSP
jgi:hypothetical protein